MNTTEGQRLADFSKAVRESTIKRLLQMPPGRENWRPSPGAMTVAAIARHIAESDAWLFQKLKDPAFPKMTEESGEAADVAPGEFQELVAGLRESGEERAALLSALTDSYLDTPMFDDRFGDVTVWWVIVRGNLDHEAHHRGGLALYLRMIRDSQ